MSFTTSTSLICGLPLLIIELSNRRNTFSNICSITRLHMFKLSQPCLSKFVFKPLNLNFPSVSFLTLSILVPANENTPSHKLSHLQLFSCVFLLLPWSPNHTLTAVYHFQIAPSYVYYPLLFYILLVTICEADRQEMTGVWTQVQALSEFNCSRGQNANKSRAWWGLKLRKPKLVETNKRTWGK